MEPLNVEKARRSLKAFLMQAWPILEPGTEFVEGIHIDEICLHLQAVSEGRIANLIINVPPSHAKIAGDGCVLARVGVDRAPRIPLVVQQLPGATGGPR